MKKMYVKLRLNRVDVVDEGANPGAHITLAKRALQEGRRMADTETPEAVAKRLADEVDVLKAEVAKARQDAEAQKAEAVKQAEAVAKMLEDAARKEAVAVAKGFDKLGTEDAKLAGVLFAAKRKLSPEEYADLTTVLTAANAQVGKGKLFAAIGTEGSEDGNASDLDRVVFKRMQEKGEERHVALAAVLKTDEGKAAYAAGRN